MVWFLVFNRRMWTSPTMLAQWLNFHVQLSKLCGPYTASQLHHKFGPETFTPVDIKKGRNHGEHGLWLVFQRVFLVIAPFELRENWPSMRSSSASGPMIWRRPHMAWAEMTLAPLWLTTRLVFTAVMSGLFKTGVWEPDSPADSGNQLV